jgi:diguanylate cyclase (GGDEF)-like protein
MEHGLPSELAVPIWYGEQRLGLITVANPQGELQVIRRMLAMMADLTGVGLHAAGQVSQIRNSAERDALTGLANRRALMARLTFELQRCISYESCTSLAMIDVDHFKQYNDQNGHQAGDQVLQTIAKLMSATTRRTDLVARYGGEEFTVILTGTDQEQAFRHAERIRKTIVEHNFPHGETQPLSRVTISIGIATFPHDATSVESLFETADKALYRAKHAGRNRVVCYNKEPRE